MSSELGLTQDQTQRIKNNIKRREKCASPSTNPTRERPPLTDTVLELRGQSSNIVHLPKPNTDDLTPWCIDHPWGYDEGSRVHEWKTRETSMAKVWREPCKCCFPEGYPDE